MPNNKLDFPEDIIKRVINEYEPLQRDAAFDILNNLYNTVKSQRVIRCVIYLSKGNISDLSYFSEQAITDFRDVIYWAEYDSSDLKLRDFEMPFN